MLRNNQNLMIGLVFVAMGMTLVVEKGYAAQTVQSFQNFENNNGTQDDIYFNSIFRIMPSTSVVEDNPRTGGGVRTLKVITWPDDTANNPDAHGGTVRIFSSRSSPVDLSVANKISAWIYDTVGSNSVQLKLCAPGSDRVVSNEVWSDPQQTTRDRWTRISWNLSAFTNFDKKQIIAIEIYVWHSGVYYFDDIEWE